MINVGFVLVSSLVVPPMIIRGHRYEERTKAGTGGKSILKKAIEGISITQ